VHRLFEGFAVLRLVNRLRRGADQPDAVLGQRAALDETHRGVERRLPAHRGKQGIRPVAFDHPLDDVQGDRFDVRPIGQFRIGHDGRRIAVDQNDPVPLLLQRLARLRAGVIEFARLADHDRAGTDK
jgi:hypothetical protein